MLKTNILRDRADMLARSRHFFQQRSILEVDCPCITLAAPVDAHIDLIKVRTGSGWRYLHSSPEYGMKRLLSMGIGDIYQLSHVFREGEKSDKHNPEFSMAEWYRCGIALEEMIEETAAYIRLFLTGLPCDSLSYRDAFREFAGVDYLSASDSQLLSCLQAHKIIPYEGIEEEGKDALLNLILGTIIEPELGKDSLCALTYYPASQAALAKKCQRGEETAAERFEIYYKGLELANGYHELADAAEQGERLREANTHRKLLGKEQLPIDNNFLEALKYGLPDCCGVAVGFDRLMMLRHQTDISSVIPFTWDCA